MFPCRGDDGEELSSDGEDELVYSKTFERVNSSPSLILKPSCQLHFPHCGAFFWLAQTSQMLRKCNTTQKTHALMRSETCLK